jgi:transposase
MDHRINEIFSANEMCVKLEKIPGVGKLGATMLVSVLGDGKAFKNGRHFAAFSGLVPKQSSSGGKEKLLGISKRGDTYMRKLLVHGARAVLRYTATKKDKESIWLQNLARRAGINKATVALANKIARQAWAMVFYKTDYQSGHMPKIAKLKSSSIATNQSFYQEEQNEILKYEI